MPDIPKPLLAAINRLPYEELHALYHYVAYRIARERQARDASELRKFAVLDYVSFFADGVRKRGTIVRLNRKSATVMLDDRTRWNVSPHLLAKVIGALSPLKEMFQGDKKLIADETI